MPRAATLLLRRWASQQLSALLHHDQQAAAGAAQRHAAAAARACWQAAALQQGALGWACVMPSMLACQGQAELLQQMATHLQQAVASSTGLHRTCAALEAMRHCGAEEAAAVQRMVSSCCSVLLSRMCC